MERTALISVRLLSSFQSLQTISSMPPYFLGIWQTTLSVMILSSKLFQTYRIKPKLPIKKILRG